MPQRAAVKDGLRNPGSQIPESCTSPKDLTESERHAADIRCQVEARQTVRYGNPDLSASGMKVFLSLEHVRSLFNQLRREAHRQFLRQLETRKRKLFGKLLVRKSTGKFGEQIALLRQLL